MHEYQMGNQWRDLARWHSPTPTRTNSMHSITSSRSCPWR